jgi:hypothetical protein
MDQRSLLRCTQPGTTHEQKETPETRLLPQPAALVHILERHYHKIPRHPGAGKFFIPISSILDYIRQAKNCTQHNAPNHSGSYRILECNTEIGYDQEGRYTVYLTVFTDIKGNILTAFPGRFVPKEQTVDTTQLANMEKVLGFA